jgi:hypothetical protein
MVINVYIQCIANLAIITVRVPDRLRRQMKRLRHINWSGVARRALEERVALEMSRESKDRAQIAEASRHIDEIFNGIHSKYGKVRYDSATTVRLWRDARYTRSSQMRQ